MKIVFVLECANILNNGTTATCLRFAKGLKAKGHEVRLVGTTYNNPDDAPDDYYPQEPFHFPFFQWLIDKEGFTFCHVDDVSLYYAIKDADLVHLFLPFKLESHARLIAESLGVPVTSAFHLLPQNITSAIHLGWTHGINTILFNSFRRYQYDYTKYVHCPSAMTAREIRLHHYRRSVPVVISNGVNTDFFHPIETQKPKELKGLYVVTAVGRLAHEKRQDLLIKAVAKSKYNDKIQLILCGQGPEKKRYLRLAKKVGLAHPLIIQFCKQDRLREILNWSDLYVHCSDFEIEGISCIEAFACGAVPLIADAHMSATNTFSLDNRCLFHHGSARSLTKRIDYFLDNPLIRMDLRQKYIDNAKNYALPLMIDQFEKMLFTAVEDHKHGTDWPSLERRKKDIIKSHRIFKKLIKQGVVEEMPESLVNPFAFFLRPLK